MLRRDFRGAVLDNDHGSTNASTVTCNEDGPVVMIDVYTNELAEASCSPQSPEITDKARGISC